MQNASLLRSIIILSNKTSSNTELRAVSCSCLRGHISDCQGSFCPLHKKATRGLSKPGDVVNSKGKRSNARKTHIEALSTNSLWDATSPTRPPPSCMGFTTQIFPLQTLLQREGRNFYVPKRENQKIFLLRATFCHIQTQGSCKSIKAHRPFAGVPTKSPD